MRKKENLWTLDQAAALAALAETYGTPCRTLAQNFLGDAYEAETCFQDACRQVWQAGQGQGDLLSALLRATRRLAWQRAPEGGRPDALIQELDRALPRREAPALPGGEGTAVWAAFFRGMLPESRRLFLRRYFFGDGIGPLAVAARQNEVAVHDQLSHLRQQLVQRLEEARRRDEQHRLAQQRLFSGISHELKTPVTVIRGSLEALRDGVVTGPEAVSAYYAQMIGETRWLQHLIRDLLELSRLQSDDFALDLSPVDLSELLSDVAMSARALCTQKGLTFACEEPSAHPQVMGDYSRLRQMLMIAVDNAIASFSEDDLFGMGMLKKLRTMKDVLEALLRRVDCVVANPPYLGIKKLNAWMVDWLGSHLKESKSALCYAFFDQYLHVGMKGSYVAMITKDGWLTSDRTKAF